MVESYSFSFAYDGETCNCELDVSPGKSTEKSDGGKDETEKGFKTPPPYTRLGISREVLIAPVCVLTHPSHSLNRVFVCLLLDCEERELTVK